MHLDELNACGGAEIHRKSDDDVRSVNGSYTHANRDCCVRWPCSEKSQITAASPSIHHRPANTKQNKPTPHIASISIDHVVESNVTAQICMRWYDHY